VVLDPRQGASWRTHLMPGHIRQIADEENKSIVHKGGLNRCPLPLSSVNISGRMGQHQSIALGSAGIIFDH